jgi:hypothetical protein
MEKKSKDVLDEIEESKAFFHVYEGAIYMNQGRNYLVTSLDIKEKVALCELVNVDYYTRTRDYTDIKVTGGDTVSITVALLFDSCASLCKIHYQVHVSGLPGQGSKEANTTNSCM